MHNADYTNSRWLDMGLFWNNIRTQKWNSSIQYKFVLNISWNHSPFQNLKKFDFLAIFFIQYNDLNTAHLKNKSVGRTKLIFVCIDLYTFLPKRVVIFPSKYLCLSIHIKIDFWNLSGRDIKTMFLKFCTSDRFMTKDFTLMNSNIEHIHSYA